MENNNAPPYQQLFELDELLVEILRHLLDDKKSINQLILTAKWLSKRLHSTALWTSIGILFYNHNGNTITPRMLWHLLRERRIELLKPSLPWHQESSEALKYLIHLARSAKEARAMMSLGYYKSLFYDIIELDQRPYMQELTCVLLHEVCKHLTGDAATEMFNYVPGIVAIIKRHEEYIGQSSLVLTACRMLDVFGSTFTNVINDHRRWFDVLRNMSSLGPIIIKLMRHSDPDLHSSGYSIAKKLTTGYDEQHTLTSLPGFWSVVTQDLASHRQPIRRDAALILSNLISDGDSPYLDRVNTEEVFRALLALRSDALEVKREVIWTFINLAASHYEDNMSETQKQLWHTYYSEIMDYCTAQVRDLLDAAQLPDEQKETNENPSLSKESVLDDALYLIGSLLDIMEDLPTKEIVKQNLIQSELAQLLQSPLLPHSTTLDEIRDRFHIGEDPEDLQQFAETDPNYNNGLFVL